MCIENTMFHCTYKTYTEKSYPLELYKIEMRNYKLCGILKNYRAAEYITM